MEHSQQQEHPLEHITLENDSGANIAFQGRLHAEHSFYDEENQALTQQRLYITSSGERAYSVVTSCGASKEKRAYLIKRENNLCKIFNGIFDVTVNAEDLMAVVHGLCGMTQNMEQQEGLEDETADKQQDRAANE